MVGGVVPVFSSSSAVNDVQVFRRADDFGSAVFFEYEQVFIAGDDVVGVGGSGAFEILVVGFIPAAAGSNPFGIGHGDFRADIYDMP